MTGKRIIDPEERERRRQAYLALDRDKADQARSRTMKLRRIENAGAIGWLQPPTVVLVPWHTDSTGCRARVVGCD